jgi:hypothetical protein
VVLLSERLLRPHLDPSPTAHRPSVVETSGTATPTAPRHRRHRARHSPTNTSDHAGPPHPPPARHRVSCVSGKAPPRSRISGNTISCVSAEFLVPVLDDASIPCTTEHACDPRLLRPRQPACNTCMSLPLPCMRVRSLEWPPVPWSPSPEWGSSGHDAARTPRYLGANEHIESNRELNSPSRARSFF